jgi:hypothetical protein
MEPINLDYDFDEKRAMCCNYMKFKEEMARLFHQHIPQKPHFGVY